MPRILGMILLLAVVSLPAGAAQRIALVVANAAYEHAPALATPLNDAAEVEAALSRLGFSVTRLDNADQSALRRGLHAFSTAARTAEAAVVYYAGHGVRVGKRNFLVPVDARLAREQDVEFEAVPLGLFERAVGESSAVRLIILDASRENPFPASAGPGLASIDPAAGTLVATVAKEEAAAVPYDSQNSLYAEVLLRYLEEPGLEIQKLFQKVRDGVLAATAGSQTPSLYGSLSDGKAYLGAQPASSLPATASTEDKIGKDDLTAEKLAAERMYWASVKDSDDPAEIRSYLERYPNGTYAELARIRLQRSSGATGPKPSSAGSEAGARSAAVREAETAPEADIAKPALPPEAAEEALTLERDHRRLVQSGLKLLGFDPGPADGIFGQRTRAAIAKWQASQDKPPTGYVDAETANILARKGNELPPSSGQQEMSRETGINILAEALQVAGAIENQFAKTQRLSQIGKILANSGDADRAAQIITFALSASRWIDDDAQRTEAFAAIAEAQAAAGDGAGTAQSIRSALATARGIEDEFTHALILLYIAEVQTSAGDGEGATQSIGSAIATVRRLNDEFLRVRLLMRISQVQASAGDRAGAAQSFRSAVAAAAQIKNIFIQGPALVAISQAQALAGDIQGALASARQIELELWRIQALADIAEEQASTNDETGAAQSIERALAVVKRMQDVGGDPPATAFVNIAEAQASVGDRAGAAQSIRKALTAVQREEDEGVRAHALAQIAQALASAGDIQDALATARRIGDEPRRDKALSEIAQEQAAAGDIPGALATANRIKNEYTRAWALMKIAELELDGNN